jgi:predicted DNA-binding transcriptional regulator YafY
MVNYMGTWHVVAYCRLRGDWRDFHVSRITLCKLEDEPFITRPDAEWRAFLDDTFRIFQNRDRFEVVLEFSSERSRWVRGEVWHPEQRMEELETGGLRLTVPVSHEAEIMMEVLKHGAHVEVIERVWLREKVKEEIDGMKKIYLVGH